MNALFRLSTFAVCLTTFVAGIDAQDNAALVADSIRQGQQLQADGKLDDAELAYDKAVELGPQLAHPYYFRAMFRREVRNDLEGAKLDLQAALRIKPTEDDFLDELSETAVRSDDMELALETARKRPDPELVAKAIVRLIRYEKWETSLQLLDDFDKQCQMPDRKSPFKPHIERLFLCKHRALALYGIGRKDEAELQANLFRDDEDAKRLPHGYYMPGLSIARIPPEPIREFNEDIAKLRVSKTVLSATEFLELVDKYDALSKFGGRFLDEIVQRGLNSQARTSQDHLSLAQIRLVAFEHESTKPVSLDTASQALATMLTNAEADLAQAKSQGADEAAITEVRARMATFATRMKSNLAKAEQMRSRAPGLIESARNAEIAALRRGQKQRAMKVWDDLLEKNPLSVEIRVARLFSDAFAATFTAEQKEAEAAEIIAVLPESHPDYRRLYELPLKNTQTTAQQLLGNSKKDEALQVWDALLARYPDRVSYDAERLMSSPFLLANGQEVRKREAVRVIDATLKSTEGDVDQIGKAISLVELVGRRLLDEYSPVAVIAMWDRLVERYPDNLGIRSARFQSPAYQYTEDVEAAIQDGELLLSRIPVGDPSRENIFEINSWFAEMAGHADQARQIWDRWLGEYSKSIVARRLRGNSRFEAREYLGAIEDYRVALEGMAEILRSERNPRLRSGPRQATIAMRDEQEQLVEMVKALESATVDCESATDYVKRGHALTLLEDDAAAVVAYSQAIELEPNSAMGHCWRATRYIALGRFDDALADINAALTIDPNSAEAFACRGALAQAQLKLDDALHDYDEAIAHNSRLGPVYERRAIIHFFRGRFEPCINDLHLTGIRSVTTMPWPLTLPIRLSRETRDRLDATTLSPHESIGSTGDKASVVRAAQIRLVAGDSQGANELLRSIRVVLSSDSPAEVLLLKLVRESSYEQYKRKVLQWNDFSSPVNASKPAEFVALDLISTDRNDESRQRVHLAAETLAKELVSQSAQNSVTSVEVVKRVESELGAFSHYDDAKKKIAIDEGKLPGLIEILNRVLDDEDGLLVNDPLLTLDDPKPVKIQALQQLVKASLYYAEAEPAKVWATLDALVPRLRKEQNVALDAINKFLSRSSQLMREKNYVQAIDHLLPTWQLIPHSPWIVTSQLGTCFYEKGEAVPAVFFYQEALDELKKADERTANETTSQQDELNIGLKVDVNKRLVDALRSEQDTLSSIEVWRELVRLQPDNPASYASLGTALYFVGQKEAAEEAFAKAIELDKSGEAKSFIAASKKGMDGTKPIDHANLTASRLTKTSSYRESMGDWKGALADLQKAIEYVPGDSGNRQYQNGLEYFYQRAAKPFLTRAQEHSQARQWRAAYDLLTEGLEVSDDWPELHRKRAFCLQKTADQLAEFDRGIKSAERIRAAYVPTDIVESVTADLAWLHLSRGHAVLSLKKEASREQLDRTALDFARALELDPQFALAYLRLGQTHLRLGQREEAERVFSKLIELDPTFAEQVNEVKALESDSDDE
jgi:tetratricopeptide (TPR) repeat protein